MMHVIRPTVKTDVATLRGVVEATDLFPGDHLEGMMEPYLSGDASGGFWLTAEAGGPVGVAYCVPEQFAEGTWNVLAIAVHPDEQGRGHGAALMRHIEETLAARGERVLLVETSGTADFGQTRAFYRGLDYDEEARIRDFWAAGDDKVVFRKALN